MSYRLLLLSQAVALVLGSAVLVNIYESLQEPGNPLALSETDRSSVETKLDERLSIYDRDKAYEGFTLIPFEGGAKVVLVNMRGQVVHSWAVDAVRTRLLPSGGLVAIHGTKWGKDRLPWKNLRDKLVEYSWNGDESWKVQGEDIFHHDLTRLPNGNTIVLRRYMVPEEMKSAISDPERRRQPIRSDAVIELDPTGKVVWEWKAHDHLDLNSCGKKGCRPFQGSDNALDQMRDWTHTNTASVIPENHWYEEGHKEFKPGNIMVLLRNWWTSFIVDRESGDIVWEYTGDYKGGISGGHESHMIPKGLPGAGNVLLFDNGRKIHSGESYVLEINPVNKEVVWVYDVGKELFSPARGSVQRLPNGNTLISEDKTGRCFEVTPEKEIVWQFREKREINRCHRYSPDYAAQLEKLIL